MTRFPLLLWRALLLYVCLALHPGVLQGELQNEPTQTPTQKLDSEPLTSLASRKEALQSLKADQVRLRESRDVIELIQTTNGVAELHLKLNDPGSAHDAAREALSLARHSGNKTLLVDTLVLSARVYRHRQDNKTALSLLNEANRLSIDLKYRPGEARSLTELSATYYPLSEMAKAESCADRALEIWRELNDRPGEATTLIGLGEIYMRVGRSQEAATALERAVILWRELGDSANQATALVDLNFLSIRLGQWQQALAFLNQAQLLMKDKEAEPYTAGQIANSFGEVYEAYGNLETALSHYEQAVRLYRDYAHDSSATVDAARQAGRVEARLGDYNQAVQRIEDALELAQEIESPVLIALCHEDLGIVHLAAELFPEAERQFSEAISRYPQSGSRREIARAQTFLGQSEYSQGKLNAAAITYHKALKIFESEQDYTDEAAVCFGLGKIALSQQKLDEAGKYLQRSIALTEQLRENASSKDLRSSFLASVHDRYETYVEWLMARHALQPDKRFDIQAFEASESGRARSLLDSLKDYQRELRQTAEPALLLDEEKLQQEEQRLLDTKAKLISGGEPEESKAGVEKELVQVRSRYEALQAQIKGNSRFTNLLRPVPLTFTEIRDQVTDAETVLLEYSLGSQKSYLWMVTSDGLYSYELPNKDAIEKAARSVAELLSKPQREPAQETALLEAAAELSHLILSPVAEKLSARRLVIVADGILQYIPFQILTASLHADQPLVANHEIVNAPSASTLAVVRREAASRRSGSKLLAAFGDPVLPSNYLLKANSGTRGTLDERTSIADQRQQGTPDDRSDDTFRPAELQPLFFTRIELNQLRDFGRQDGSVIYSEFNATRDNLRKLDLSQFRILHFATHGFLNAKQPELSGLVLSLVDARGQSVDGFVGLADIYNLHAPVDLVVLSACQTALGKDVRGEGLIGLTRGFMYAGASSVVASLWKVDDEATTELMKHFYTNMLQKGMTPAAALRAAQNTIRKQPQWASPHYWAAFTLQGDYRQVIQAAPRRPWSTYSVVFSVSVLGALVLITLWYFRLRARWGTPTK